jgi:hypothetical protein
MITISSVAPNPTNLSFKDLQHSSMGRMTALALGADGSRMYAGSFAGVWRSDDAGQNWRQLTWPQPGVIEAEIPGALFAPHVFDLAVSPTDPNVVLVSAVDSQFVDRRDGIYLTTDGGTTWNLVLQAEPQYNANLGQFVSLAASVVFAPDDPQLAYAATGTHVAVSQNGGVSWNAVYVGNSAWHVAVGPLENDGITRRVYAAGDNVIWYSSNGGASWKADTAVASTIGLVRKSVAAFQQFCGSTSPLGGFAGQTSYAAGTGGGVLAVEPGNPAKVYLATEGGANGPTYYSGKVADGTLCNTVCERLAGEASLWYGDFSNFEANSGALWTILPGPPTYLGVTSPSGNTYVVTKATSSGFLVFFSDNSHVHVSSGTPATYASWHRLDGLDPSTAHQAGIHRNTLFMHADPHGIAFTPDFEITLKPTTQASPYNLNSELDQYVGGTIWMANDGGVCWAGDGGKNADSWKLAMGLETLDPVNIAGLFGLGNEPALYFGCGDNSDFFSRDGGSSWGDPGTFCGDCDCWFSDVAQADRVMQFIPLLPQGGITGFIGVIRSGDSSQYPDASDGSSKHYSPSTRQVSAGSPPALVPYASSGQFLNGYRPMIKTLATEAGLPDGDFVFIDQDLTTRARTLLRTTAISSIVQLSDWADPTKATPIGTTLPATTASIVQVGGGHYTPVYYVADMTPNMPTTGTVWKWNVQNMSWDQIVPQPGPGVVGAALRWFVDPYDSDTLYVLDKTGVKFSVDGGVSWEADPVLTNALTAGGKLYISASLLQDMLFMRGERQTRFTLGTAGVYCTMDFGVTWFPVLNSIALPGRPESGFFDPLSNQSDRAIYVEMEGRSLLRIGGLPDLPPFQPPPVFDLLEFAAILTE